MNSAAFLRLIKKRAPVAEVGGDPLKDARLFIQAHGNTGEGKVLRAVVQALWNGEGDFNETDIWSLGSRTLALASALIDARIQNQYQESQWRIAWSESGT